MGPRTPIPLSATGVPVPASTPAGRAKSPPPPPRRGDWVSREAPPTCGPARPRPPPTPPPPPAPPAPARDPPPPDTTPAPGQDPTPPSPPPPAGSATFRTPPVRNPP